MKTFKQYLKETWVANHRNFNDDPYMPIFKNPSRSELKELLDHLKKEHGTSRMLRLLVGRNGKGNVYAFPYLLLHGYAQDKLPTEGKMVRAFFSFEDHIVTTEGLNSTTVNEQVRSNIQNNRNFSPFNVKAVKLWGEMNEKWKGMYNAPAAPFFDGGDYDIFLNPTPTEIKDIQKNTKIGWAKDAIRALVMNAGKGDVYAFSASLFHPLAIKLFKKEGIPLKETVVPLRVEFREGNTYISSDPEAWVPTFISFNNATQDSKLRQTTIIRKNLVNNPRLKRILTTDHPDDIIVSS